MSKTFLVAKREYLENLRTKTFWIGILFMPIIIIISMTVPFFLEKVKDVRKYAVLDQSGWLLDAVMQKVEGPDTLKVFQEILSKKDVPADSPEALPKYLSALLPILKFAEKGDQLSELARNLDRLRSPEGQEILSSIPEGLMPDDLDSTQILGPLQEYFKQIHKWWSELPEEKQNELRAEEQIGKYERVTFDDLGADPREGLNQKLEDGKIFAYFVISKNPQAGEGESVYVSKNQSDPALRRWFQNLAGEEIRERLIRESHIDTKVASMIRYPIRFETTKLSEEGKEEKATGMDAAKQYVPVAFVYLLWIAIFMLAQMLLTNTIEEKSNRILEVLLSSVSPLQIMMGKIFGIAATGLTMIISWVVCFLVALKVAPIFFSEMPDVNFLAIVDDPLFLLSFIVYFCLGFLLHASFIAGIGSVCTSVKESQNLMMPVTLLLILPLLAMMPIAKDPNGTLAKVLSFIPPFTPFVMMNRAAGPPEVWEYVVTTIILFVSVIISMWSAAKIFRVGILLTGKPPRLFEILKWLKAPVGHVPEAKEEG